MEGAEPEPGAYLPDAVMSGPVEQCHSNTDILVPTAAPGHGSNSPHSPNQDKELGTEAEECAFYSEDLHKDYVTDTVPHHIESVSDSKGKEMEAGHSSGFIHQSDFVQTLVELQETDTVPPIVESSGQDPGDKAVHKSEELMCEGSESANTIAAKACGQNTQRESAASFSCTDGSAQIEGDTESSDTLNVQGMQPVDSTQKYAGVLGSRLLQESESNITSFLASSNEEEHKAEKGEVDFQQCNEEKLVGDITRVEQSEAGCVGQDSIQTPSLHAIEIKPQDPVRILGREVSDPAVKVEVMSESDTEKAKPLHHCSVTIVNDKDWNVLVCENLAKYYEAQELCDTIVHSADGASIAAHSCVLASGSKTFYTKLEAVGTLKDISYSRQVTFDNLDLAILQQVIHFLYHGHVTLALSSVNELIEAAKFLEIESLESACQSVLSTVGDITSVNRPTDFVFQHEKSEKREKKILRLDFLQGKVPLQKRKVGRPPGSTKKNKQPSSVIQWMKGKPVVKHLQDPTAAEQPLESKPDIDAPLKRRRGRPPKKRSSDLNEGQASAQGTGVNQQETLPAVKAKRGRPCKQTSGQSVSQKPSTESEKPKKRRGRPPKHAIKTQATELSPLISSSAVEEEDTTVCAESPPQIDQSISELSNDSHFTEDVASRTVDAPYDKDRQRSIRRQKDKTVKGLVRKARAVKKSRQLLSHSQDPQECPVCRKMVKGDKRLRRHLLVHAEKKKFICQICGKSFLSNYGVRRHEDTHKDTRSYDCGMCDKSFRTYDNMQRHRKYTHIQSNITYQCQFCGKSFNRGLSLRRHEIACSGQRPFKCETCGKLFGHQNVLRNHMVTHESTCKHKCKYCDRGFNRSDNLKVHMRMHTGEKPYACAYCGDQFRHNVTLKAHIRSHHPNKPQPESLTGPSPSKNYQKSESTPNNQKSESNPKYQKSESKPDVQDFQSLSTSYQTLVAANYQPSVPVTDPTEGVFNIAPALTSQHYPSALAALALTSPGISSTASQSTGVADDTSQDLQRDSTITYQLLETNCKFT